MGSAFEGFEVISSYSRAQALEDGVLVDVSAMAREAGFRVPVALTDATWADCVAWCDADAVRGAEGQSEAGRLWDVVYMAAHAARVHKHSGTDRLTFSVLRVPRGKRRVERVELVVHIGGGDHREALATIMRPNED